MWLAGETDIKRIMFRANFENQQITQQQDSGQLDQAAIVQVHGIAPFQRSKSAEKTSVITYYHHHYYYY